MRHCAVRTLPCLALRCVALRIVCSIGFRCFCRGMWGIATATTMSLHRLRMGTKPLMAGHCFFGTFMIVMLPSYYFCYRRREHQEQVIEMMMKYNQFGHATELPAEPPLEEHPFWEQTQNGGGGGGGFGSTTGSSETKHDREFRGLIKERKEWQKKAQDPSFDEIFQEKK
uniref:Cytochrome c oxidase assembly protein COX20, mitochondrial n=1 Tax=Pseudo-nitzschia australis TaxID=44445 RepID=A0A6U9X0Y9_9STRA